MASELTPPGVEDLLAQAVWLRRLALRLVHDEATADDLTQEALLAALRRPDAARLGLRAWLAGAVRHLLSRRIREESARRRREQSVARGEALPSRASTSGTAATAARGRRASPAFSASADGRARRRRGRPASRHRSSSPSGSTA
jgi:DNA-directed RNA polymerase specialized sigma24 family protein